MTKLLEQAFEKAQALPAEIQDQIARTLLAYAGEEEMTSNLTPDEIADMNEAKAEVARGEIASKTEVEAVLLKFKR